MFVSGPSGTSVISPGAAITWSTMNCAAWIDIGDALAGGEEQITHPVGPVDADRRSAVLHHERLAGARGDGDVGATSDLEELAARSSCTRRPARCRTRW